jgi:exonuclease III
MTMTPRAFIGIFVSFQHTIHHQILDKEGRYIILDISINDKRMTLINVYGPNEDEPIFFTMLMEQFDNNNLTILGGDVNTVQDYSLDTLNTKHRNNPKSHEEINMIKEDLDLYDPWRVQNPETKMYTWHNSTNKLSRLDYFLVSAGTMNIIETTIIKPGYRSDHSIVELTLNLSKHKKGPGLWKFNNSLLKDNEYVNEIKKCIADTTAE